MHKTLAADFETPGFLSSLVVCGLAAAVVLSPVEDMVKDEIGLSLFCGWAYAFLSVKGYAAWIAWFNGDRSVIREALIYLLAKGSVLVLFLFSVRELSQQSFWYALTGFLLLIPAALVNHCFQAAIRDERP